MVATFISCIIVIAILPYITGMGCHTIYNSKKTKNYTKGYQI